MIWLKFSICVLIILVAGRRVARYGDVIAEKTGLGGLWVGLVLLSVVTSLPELFNGISSVVLVNAPDLTVGDLFGSNVINLLIIAGADAIVRGRPVLSTASPRHLLPAALSIVLVAFAAVCIPISTRVWDMGVGWIGIYTLIIPVMYFVFMRITYKYEQRHLQQSLPVADEDISHGSLRGVYVRFAIAALFVIGAGTWLAYIGRDIAESTGWGQSFVGSLFVAFSTSLPEITVTIAALQLGAVDMCLADIIGSNMFNMVIICSDDLLYRRGPILAAISEDHALTGVIVGAMTCVVMIALATRVARKTRLGFAWYVPLLVALFVVSSYLTFSGSG